MTTDGNTCVIVQNRHFDESQDPSCIQKYTVFENGTYRPFKM